MVDLGNTTRNLFERDGGTMTTFILVFTDTRSTES